MDQSGLGFADRGSLTDPEIAIARHPARWWP
jgi:hypothetical protein